VQIDKGLFFLRSIIRGDDKTWQWQWRRTTMMDYWVTLFGWCYCPALLGEKFFYLLWQGEPLEVRLQHQPMAFLSHLSPGKINGTKACIYPLRKRHDWGAV
jgi:hypothetical protein